MFLHFQIILGLIGNVMLQDHVIPKFKRGPVELVDETALTNPNSFDYDFSEDLTKPVDNQDLYDQFIDQLPMFHMFKLGKDRGVTQVPIVTRIWDTWFTPTTLSNKEQKFTFYSTTPMTPRKTEETRQTTVTSRKPTTTQKTTTTSTTTTTTQTATLPTTTTATTTATTTLEPSTTSRNSFVQNQRKPAFRQPAPVFKQTTTTEAPINRGPVWKKGGIVIDTTTTNRPTTPRTWTRRTFTPRFITLNAITTTTVATTERKTSPTTTTTTTTTTQTPTTTEVRRFVTVIGHRWVAGPRRQPQFQNNWKQPIRNLQRTLERPVPPTHTDPISRGIPKPVVIQNPEIHRYAGPTYNCRVLNPFTDGKPSNEHDENCKMLYPGLSLDGSCRCFYKVAGRDSHGCATGFIYACRTLSHRSVSV